MHAASGNNEWPHPGPHCRGYSALSLTSVVVADSTPVRGLVSVVAVCCAQVLILRLAVVAGPARSSTQGKVINEHPQNLASRRRARHHSDPARGVRRWVQRRRRRWRSGRRRRNHADPGRLRGARTGLEQDHPGVRGHRRGQGRGRDHVLRRLGRPVARRRRRQARRHRQLLRRARRHPAGQGRQGGQGLERRRHQGHPVRFGGFAGRPQGQPEEHQGLGRPAAARARGRHPEPAELRLGQVEPVGAVRRQEQRRQGPAGRPRLRHQAGHRARQDAARFRSGSHRRVPAGHRRRADQLRERGDQRRAAGQAGRARQPAADLQDREPGRGRHLQHASGSGQRAEELPVHHRRDRRSGRRPASGRSTRRSPRTSRTTSRRRRSCGPSTTWVDGARSIRRCSTRTTAASPRSTSRPLDDSCSRIPEAIRPEPTGDGEAGPPRGFFKSRYGSTSLRVGVATTWLSIIVLLPLAAIVWQSAGGGWDAFWTRGDVERRRSSRSG